MTATDELREGLRERGIEYRWQDERTTYWYGTFDGREWCEWTAIEYDGYLRVTCADCGELLTPEQAIEATLGRGECKVDVLNTGDCAGYECSEYIMHCNACGHEFGHVLYNEDGDVWMSEPPNFCPNCGRKVVDE